jgi:hypothetical protein
MKHEEYQMTLRAQTTKFAAVAGLGLSMAMSGNVLADTAVVGSAKDNSIIEILFVDPSSNGMGDGMFAGRSGVPHIARAVMAFDLTAIPAGSTITSVSLQLHLVMAAQLGPDEQTQSLHRMLGDWGEGASVGFGGTGAPAQPGDATWLHSFFPDQYWTNEGGDFDPAISASTLIGTIEPDGIPVPYSWSSPQLVADVQTWVNDPTGNFGWMLRGNELEEYTSRRYATREHLDLAIRPMLTVEFAPPQVCAGDLNDDQTVNVQDLLAVINAWGACPQPCPPSCSADINGDCIANVQDLLAVINAWGACP